MAILSAFADEISTDLDEQIAVLKENSVDFIELRGVWGKNVLKLTPRELRDVRHAADAEGIGFSSIGSPLGKFPLDGNFQEQMDGVKRALEYASVLNAPYIRVFSFWIPKGDDPAAHRTQVLDWLGRLVAEADKTDVTLAHENEKGIYGETGDRCLDLLTSIDSASFECVFDFANFVQAGEGVRDCWAKLRDRLAYFHIKDVDRAAGKVVPAGHGDGEIAVILADAYSRGFGGFLSLEPHLGAEFGEMGAARFKSAADALKETLREIGQDRRA